MKQEKYTSLLIKGRTNIFRADISFLSNGTITSCCIFVSSRETMKICLKSIIELNGDLLKTHSCTLHDAKV